MTPLRHKVRSSQDKTGNSGWSQLSKVVGYEFILPILVSSFITFHPAFPINIRRGLTAQWNKELMARMRNNILINQMDTNRTQCFINNFFLWCDYASNPYICVDAVESEFIRVPPHKEEMDVIFFICAQIFKLCTMFFTVWNHAKLKLRKIFL